MGHMKESNLKTEAMEKTEKLKGECDDAFKAPKYEEAHAKYTKVKDLTNKNNDKNTNL